MKLIELKKIIDSTLENYGDERGGNLNVSIPIRGFSMGPIATVKVKGATSGIDWNSGMFLIWAEADLQKVEQ